MNVQGPFGYSAATLRARDSSTGIQIRVNKKAKIATNFLTNNQAQKAAIILDRDLPQNFYTAQNRLHRDT